MAQVTRRTRNYGVQNTAATLKRGPYNAKYRENGLSTAHYSDTQKGAIKGI